MEPFWKGTAGILIVAVLGLTVGKKEFSLLLNLAGCCLVLGLVFVYLEPVVDFLEELEAAAGGLHGMLGTLLKCIGVALTAEVAGMLCQDCGSGALGKALHLLGTAAILYLSVPVFRSVLDLIREILGGMG